MKKILIIIALIFTISNMSAQQRIVKGRVLLNDDFGIGNIVVSAKKSKASVITSPNGTFSIACEDNDVLKFKSKSFFSQSKSIKGIDSLDVYLIFKEGQKNIDIARNEGYLTDEGINQLKNSLSTEEIDYSSYSNIYELMRGKLNGVEVSGNAVRIRGSHSLSGSNTAAFLVNGIFVTDVSDISPINIKSIKVLKSADAAIYGSEGLYGVIVIETK